MNKLLFDYGSFCGDDKQMIASVTVYDSEPQQDGTHISASILFSAHVLRKLSKKNIEALFTELTGAIEACNREIESRKSISCSKTIQKSNASNK